ncbi:hypothetical protein HYPSUDRAFT_169258 [Hypholoma sublateritium FD-334 SS-4]|uniref:Uncharacterized protein n=1 Tax=Hypholoma sublateritium (strain FD-334 SS-4) TaxID=945553 RepID=A0A0D2KUQ2_HYPSF|nr:hypothetical protein HYPSUDRAFT_169258 [Hypholoma sublateritium FD-334 SS-4]
MGPSAERPAIFGVMRSVHFCSFASNLLLLHEPDVRTSMVFSSRRALSLRVAFYMTDICIYSILILHTPTAIKRQL